MSKKCEYGMVMTTIDDQDDANQLAAAIVEEKLAACVQIMEITSHYIWDGDNQIGKEYLLLLKTRRSLYDRIEGFIRNRHGYAVPEIILVPIETGFDPYLTWIRESTA